MSRKSISTAARSCSKASGADAIDVGLGSGPDLAFVAKGNTDLAIAVFAGPPNSQVLIVRAEEPVHTVADLKGKKVGLSTVGSLTDWLVLELSRQQGLGTRRNSGGVPLGSESGRTASLRTGTTMVIDVATATKLEKEKIGRIVVHFATVAPDFIIHAIFATDKAIAEKPDLLKRFLAGWLQTINGCAATRTKRSRSPHRSCIRRRTSSP